MFPSGFTYSYAEFQNSVMDSLTIYGIKCAIRWGIEMLFFSFNFSPVFTKIMEGRIIPDKHCTVISLDIVIQSL